MRSAIREHAAKSYFHLTNENCCCDFSILFFNNNNNNKKRAKSSSFLLWQSIVKGKHGKMSMWIEHGEKSIKLSSSFNVKVFAAQSGVCFVRKCNSHIAFCCVTLLKQAKSILYASKRVNEKKKEFLFTSSTQTPE